MPIFLVAEIGCNWENIAEAYEMIKAAKDAGASFCKFQLFNEKTIADSPLRDRLTPLILVESQIEHLHAYAKQQGIGFILTPMYLEAVDIAAKHCDYIKIRYADHDNLELIEKALDTGKILLISVPNKLVDAFTRHPYHPRMKGLYCLNRYPPEIEDFNLDLASACDGFSSHFPHTICDLACAINRLQDEYFIEKHVMLSTKKVGIVTNYSNGSKERIATVDVASHPIDEKVSISFEDLKNFISQIHMIEKIKRTRI